VRKAVNVSPLSYNTVYDPLTVDYSGGHQPAVGLLVPYSVLLT